MNGVERQQRTKNISGYRPVQRGQDRISLNVILPGTAILNHSKRRQMKTPASPKLTELLLAWGEGNEQALDQFLPLVYRELHRMARHYMAGERPGHTLQASALVNEAYLRLVDVRRMQWQNRAHFFGVAAQLMRRILVDFGRRRHYQKRGAGIRPVRLNEALDVAAAHSTNLMALDDALNALGEVDPRRVRVVELRFFAGLTVEETAEVLKVSPETVLRDWRLAKTWLHRELRKDATA